ncbi:hypothetical protein [Prauserella endophytica]|nr:hypothetical protein [Prauserella endophytica]
MTPARDARADTKRNAGGCGNSCRRTAEACVDAAVSDAPLLSS